MVRVAVWGHCSCKEWIRVILSYHSVIIAWVIFLSSSFGILCPSVLVRWWEMRMFCIEEKPFSISKISGLWRLSADQGHHLATRDIERQNCRWIAQCFYSWWFGAPFYHSVAWKVGTGPRLPDANKAKTATLLCSIANCRVRIQPSNLYTRC